jgi:ubiquinone/menaquinone biosynthesis C-methylase UbiE
MAQMLEVWGEGTTWREIEFLVASCEGRVLDIACGTGKVMAMLGQPGREMHGCDISDMLISKAVARGLPSDRLQVCDATKMPYVGDAFDYSYSIGSLEHFTEPGIEQVIREAARVTKFSSFHMVPVSRSGRNEGWLKTQQSYHNCSTDWWTAHFAKHFPIVEVLDSRWDDRISVGKWFVCRKGRRA